MRNQYGQFTIICPAGSGGFGAIYAVVREGDSKAYILKTLKKVDPTTREIELFKKEIDIINILNKDPRNDSIPILYYYDKNNIPPSLPYFVIDFYSKGNLYLYLKQQKYFLSERHAKVIFKKIVKAIESCHSKNICHFDIKPGNIVFNKNFEPIIIDFGLADIYKESNSELIAFTNGRGTDNYKSPEMWGTNPFYGVKCDIFSLGVLLFNLVTKKIGFYKSKDDPYYIKIINGENNNYSEYWDIIKNGIDNFEKLSENFKKLYISMVAYNPDNRPTIEEILKSDWLKEINNLTPQENDVLEKEVKNELNKIYEEIQEDNGLNIVEGLNFLGYETRCKKEGIFKNKNIKPKNFQNNRLNINPFIKINGKLDEVDFMNCLGNEILTEIKRSNIQRTNKKDLKYDFIIEKKEESKQEEEEENEEEAEEEKEIMECKMEIELFEFEKGGYILEFLRTEGDIQKFYDYFFKIKEIIKKMIKNCS